jgi:hypothetical protein
MVISESPVSIASNKAFVCRVVRHLFEAAFHLGLGYEDEMAIQIERKAHALWREAGETDMPTLRLWEHVQDVVLGLEAGTIVAN